MLFDIRQYTNFLCVSGSHAYGTATETSDVDIQGFCSVPRHVLLSFYKNFEQNDQHYSLDEYPFKEHLLEWIKKNGVSAKLEEPLDQCIFSLKKFFKLSADANPNLYTLAFADPSCVIYQDEIGEAVRKNAHLFLSSRVRYSFSGYAFAQLKRLRSHRNYVLNPPDHDPLRKEFDLPERPIISRDQLQAAETLVDKVVREWLCAESNFDKEVVDTIRGTLTEFFATYINDKEAIENADTLAARSLGFSEDFIAVLKREKAYRKAKNEWKQYQSWKENRNPERAELEKKYLYDPKHAMHLFRLLNQCVEILTTGQVIIKRPDAELLLSIRNGAWTYEQLIKFAEDKEKEIEDIYRNKKYVVPDQPDREALDSLYISLASPDFS